jgi:SAM-dependent methyltransferase
MQNPTHAGVQNHRHSRSHNASITMTTRYYDARDRRLIYVDTPATPEFWDANWEGQRLSRESLLNPQPTTWSRITEEFLEPDDGPVLEGGCGTGSHVAAIRSAGYSVIGIDFAQRTVNALNELVPELDVRLGDVRSLDFEDSQFAGYWSLGVIEHFWDGYGEIAAEAHRVLKPGGIFFLVYPYVNPLRGLKGRLRLVPRWNGSRPDDFYQFALNTKRVQADFEELGFELVERRNVLGRQGFTEEMPRYSSVLNLLYKSESRNIATRLCRRLLHGIASRLMKFTCYSDLLVLRKHQ